MFIKKLVIVKWLCSHHVYSCEKKKLRPTVVVVDDRKGPKNRQSEDTRKFHVASGRMGILV